MTMYLRPNPYSTAAYGLLPGLFARLRFATAREAARLLPVGRWSDCVLPVFTQESMGSLCLLNINQGDDSATSAGTAGDLGKLTSRIANVFNPEPISQKCWSLRRRKPQRWRRRPPD